jgi:hypothetical protein
MFVVFDEIANSFVSKIHPVTKFLMFAAPEKLRILASDAELLLLKASDENHTSPLVIKKCCVFVLYVMMIAVDVPYIFSFLLIVLLDVNVMLDVIRIIS